MSMQPRIPMFVVIGRIVAVVGLSLALALAVFFLLAGALGLAAAAFVTAVPFGVLIFLIERAPGGASSAATKSGPTPG